MDYNISAAIEKVGKQFNEKAGDLASRLGELEKRAAREPSRTYIADNDNPLVAALSAHREFGQFDFDARKMKRFDLGEMAAITSGTGTVGATTSGGTSLVPAHRLPGIVTAPDRELTVRDLLAQGVTTSNLVEWPAENVYTNNAGPQTEGETKGASDLTFELKSAKVQTLAHTFTASKQILDDAPGLASYIGNRGVAGLKLVEENQILSGNGTGQNLNGILPQSTAFSTALLKTGDNDEYAYLRRAIQQVRLTERRANGILLHPNAAADMDLLRETDSGKYWIDPAAGRNGIAWRLPVIETTAIDEDQFVVADWTSAMIFDRQQVTVELSTEHADYFARNLCMVRVEERLALAVFEPAAFVLGEFGAVTG